MIRGAHFDLSSVLILVAATIGAISSPADIASAATVQPSATDDFRAAYATPQDAAEGKRLADASCTRCHGPNGISTANGVPHLAGQRAVYLHIGLQAYRSGTRGKNTMADAARFLSDDALVKVAAYYLCQPRSGPTRTGGHCQGHPRRV